MCFVESFLPDALLLSNPVVPPHSVARDPTDRKFLGLAVAANADFVVTNDRRDLVHVGSYKGVAIVTPAELLRRLD